MTKEDKFFCSVCGMQLTTVNEISLGVCQDCKKKGKAPPPKRSFYCSICGTRLYEMKEIAQGICDHCKASILRKLK